MNALVNHFMQHHKLLISTLSPVHIGCGEDYEPTNYVIDDGLLYAFDTTALAAMLSDKQRIALLQIVSGANALLGVQKFIYELRKEIPAFSTHIVNTCPSLAKKYSDCIGKEGKVINALAIPRVAYNPYSMNSVLLGSSIKGAIRTALLNKRNAKQTGRQDKNNNKRFEKELLGGEFNTDPMRLFKIGDAQAVNPESIVDNKVIWDCNLNKQLRKDRSVMREVISEMNSQCFQGEVGIQQFTTIIDKKGVPPKPFSFSDMVIACNQFYGELFEKELNTLQALNCLDQKWLSAFEVARPHLDQLLKLQKAMLVRVGRHSGAEGVTIEGVRHIEIRQGKGVTSKFLDHATTLWLAGDKEKSRQNLIPFGWLLIEIDPDHNDEHSQAIANILREYNHVNIETQQQRQGILQQKQKQLVAEKQRLRDREEELERRSAEEAAAAHQEADRIAALSVEQQAIAEIIKWLELPMAKNTGPGDQRFSAKAATIANAAVSWKVEDRNTLIEILPGLLKHLGIDWKKNKPWKKRINALKNG